MAFVAHSDVKLEAHHWNAGPLAAAVVTHSLATLPENFAIGENVITIMEVSFCTDFKGLSYMLQGYHECSHKF